MYFNFLQHAKVGKNEASRLIRVLKLFPVPCPSIATPVNSSMLEVLTGAIIHAKETRQIQTGKEEFKVLFTDDMALHI